jgi:hypothetical protein
MPRKPWVPRKNEAAFFHHIYIDESSQNDHDYMVLGGIVVPLAFAQQLEEDLDNAKPPNWRGIGSDGFPREIGWKLVSNGSFERYKKIVDAYASFGHRRLDGIANAGRVMLYYSVVDLHIPGRVYSGNRRGSIAFEREMYFHCLSIARRDYQHLWHVYPDDRSSRVLTEREFSTLLSRGMAKSGAKRIWPARRLNYRDSRDVQAIQVSDVICGAIAYHLNGHYDDPKANKDRRLLSDYVLDRFKIRPYVEQKKDKGFGPLVLWFREHIDKPVSRHPTPA